MSLDSQAQTSLIGEAQDPPARQRSIVESTIVDKLLPAHFGEDLHDDGAPKKVVPAWP
jgi:hypothetical protein